MSHLSQPVSGKTKTTLIDICCVKTPGFANRVYVKHDGMKNIKAFINLMVERGKNVPLNKHPFHQIVKTLSHSGHLN
jgi:hypothetical protein